MTKAETIAAIRALPMHARWSHEWQEWRVTFPVGTFSPVATIDNAIRERVACYAPSREDALDTARAMREHYNRNPQAYTKGS